MWFVAGNLLFLLKQDAGWTTGLEFPIFIFPSFETADFFHLEKKNHSSTAARTIHKAPLHVYIYIYTTRYCAHKLDSASIAHCNIKNRKLEKMENENGS